MKTRLILLFAPLSFKEPFILQWGIEYDNGEFEYFIEKKNIFLNYFCKKNQTRGKFIKKVKKLPKIFNKKEKEKLRKKLAKTIGISEKRLNDFIKYG